ncbi:MAG: HDOD domain-containing protein [Phycisphaeraceae bacterium]|nr:HDOD domain-containing protein [Phycisphaeraceae bacterium]
MTDSRLEGVLAGPRLPSLPAVAIHVLRLSEQPNTTLDEIAAAVEFDQALVVKILRTVNSSYYGLQRECGSVAQAMSYLGLRAVRSLVLGFSLAKSLDGGAEGEIDFPWRNYWKRAVRSAAAARLIAVNLQGVDPDEAQVTGLLTEIGMVALYRAYGDRYLQVIDAARNSHRLLALAEQRAFEVDHAEVGRLMALRWNLPADMADAIGGHEQFPDSSRSALCRVAMLAGLAERAIGDVNPTARAEAEVAFLKQASVQLGLPMPRAEKLLESISQRAFELAAILELDIGPAHDPEALLTRARKLQGDGADRAAVASDAVEPNGFEERLATGFDSAGTERGVAIAVIEPDGAGSGALRTRPDEPLMARLQATVSDSIDTLASVHRLSPTMVALIFETTNSRDAERGILRAVERLRRDIEVRRLTLRDGALLTVSVGVAIHGSRRFESPDSLMRAAMLALGAAQRSGRNRVGHYKAAYDPSAI